MHFDRIERHNIERRTLLASRLDQLEGRIAEACVDVGRRRSDVRVIAVTKTVHADVLRDAQSVGLHDFGENKVQEAGTKLSPLSDLPVRWCMIGHLQSNKVKYVARFASEFHALDRLELAELLDRRLAREGRTLDVYVQVDTSGGRSGYGLRPEALDAFADALSTFPRLKPRGLMTLAVASSDRGRVRSCFQLLRELRDRLSVRHADFRELSMGMSSDFEDAIREGADVVRIGQAIFGTRPTPDSHYWPEARRRNDLSDATTTPSSERAPTVDPSPQEPQS